MFHLKNAAGEMVSNNETTKMMVQDFFINLFTKEDNTSCTTLIVNMFPRLNDGKSESINTPFTTDNITMIMLICHISKLQVQMGPL